MTSSQAPHCETGEQLLLIANRDSNISKHAPLADALLALKICSGIQATVNLAAEVDGNNRIGKVILGLTTHGLEIKGARAAALQTV